MWYPHLPYILLKYYLIQILYAILQNSRLRHYIGHENKECLRSHVIDGRLPRRSRGRENAKFRLTPRPKSWYFLAVVTESEKIYFFIQGLKVKSCFSILSRIAQK